MPLGGYRGATVQHWLLFIFLHKSLLLLKAGQCLFIKCIIWYCWHW